MVVRLYGNSESVGWLGWIEAENGRCLGFIRMNGSVKFDW